jgi:hypothetical protein
MQTILDRFSVQLLAFVLRPWLLSYKLPTNVKASTTFPKPWQSMFIRSRNSHKGLVTASADQAGIVSEDEIAGLLGCQATGMN